MFDTRAVSRERVIGISFVDILIQAVFLLLLMLMVGYVDPEETESLRATTENAEFAGVGKDACEKLEQRSLRPCKQTLTPLLENLKVMCADLGIKDLRECQQRLGTLVDNFKGAGTVLYCQKTSDPTTKPPPNAYFEIPRPGSVVFKGLSGTYLSYLNEKADQKRLAWASAMQKRIGEVFSVDALEESFSILREDSCRGEVFVTTTGPYSDAQLRSERRAAYSLREARQQ